jgi:hypothetical protein
MEKLKEPSTQGLHIKRGALQARERECWMMRRP